MKKTIIVFIIIILFILICIFAFNKTFFKTTYKSGRYSIFVPRFSFLYKVGGAQVGTFISLRSKKVLEEEINL